MTNESDDIDETPEGEGRYETGLWAEARHWVGWLTVSFGRMKDIAFVGLSRRAALRCRNWLWSIEGIVRRLILAAAMSLDPASLTPLVKPKPKANSKPQPEPEPEPQTKEPAEPPRPSAAFRVFAVHTTPGARNPPRVLSLDQWVAMAPKAKRKPPPPPPEHRHLAFPADDLLTIGAAHARRKDKRPHSKHRGHPLDRRGRVSRWDPDYSYDEAKEAASYRDWLLGRTLDRRNIEPRPPPRERRHRDIHDPYLRRDSFEWRRIAEEWDRVIPAPDLAGRIMALARVIARPERWIERIARQLKANARLIALLSAVPPPRLDKPKRDRGPIPPGLDCLGLAHAAIPRLDSS